MLSTAYNMSFDAEMIERLCIVGTRPDCAEQIHRFMEAGAEAVCFNLLADPHDYDRRMEQLCADVLPQLRAIGGPSSSDDQGARGIVDERDER